MNKRNENSSNEEREERERIADALESIQPRTPLGERLIELSLRGLEKGVEPLSADEILEDLGHEPYENVC